MFQVIDINLFNKKNIFANEKAYTMVVGNISNYMPPTERIDFINYQHKSGVTIRSNGVLSIFNDDEIWLENIAKEMNSIKRLPNVKHELYMLYNDKIVFKYNNQSGVLFIRPELDDLIKTKLKSPLSLADSTIRTAIKKILQLKIIRIDVLNMIASTGRGLDEDVKARGIIINE